MMLRSIPSSEVVLQISPGQEHHKHGAPGNYGALAESLKAKEEGWIDDERSVRRPAGPAQQRHECLLQCAQGYSNGGRLSDGGRDAGRFR